MAIHLFIGAAIFAAALASIVVLALIIAAAVSSGRTIGQEIPGRNVMATSGGFQRYKGQPEGARCYWDCLSAFHWDDGWKDHCLSACGLIGKRGTA